MVSIKHQPLPISPPSTPPGTPTPANPRCPLCGAGNPHLTKYITRTSNRNANAGRPYLRCDPCNRFVTFTDKRGVHEVNPHCQCDKPSRIQVASKHKGRGLHFVCSTGVCKFYEEAKDEAGKISLMDEQMVKQLASLKLI
ncbi:hypothetical protein M409DRAFT_71684 [Zasmidium cellare ATCC 36951]|uniref:GRF-like zinc ribbon domain-containing protein n=1 Tax=Zasmidium cellare ATCC 36951 TaxID=1080233 RepID=A0A6A6BV27_ZASCE|nr:uncharacterized protein M409DRAFT_71684 [Zasmidium cellare ATCC 36951]KAF2158363.1 hypothetical protein M409DRAFT_71684 [Zasmidium cellare ATCC 36951]